MQKTIASLSAAVVRIFLEDETASTKKKKRPPPTSANGVDEQPSGLSVDAAAGSNWQRRERLVKNAITSSRAVAASAPRPANCRFVAKKFAFFFATKDDRYDRHPCHFVVDFSLFFCGLITATIWSRNVTIDAAEKSNATRRQPYEPDPDLTRLPIQTL